MEDSVKWGGQIFKQYQELVEVADQQICVDRGMRRLSTFCHRGK